MKTSLILILSVFSIQAFTQGVAPTMNGTVAAQDEVMAPEKEQVRIRLYGDAARVLCSSLGFQLDQFSGKSFIGSKGSYTCMTTKNAGEFIAGHIVLPNGEVKNLEVDGYN